MSRRQDRNDAKRGKLSIVFDDILRDLALLHDYEDTIAWCIENKITMHFEGIKHIKICNGSGKVIGEGSNLFTAVENAQEAMRRGYES